MKILITGGAGFIGSHIAEKFYNETNEIYILDNLRTGHRSNVDFIDDSHFINNDITKKDFVIELIKKEQFDIVIHLAAIVSVIDTINDPILSQSVNIDGTLNLLEANRKYNKNIKKFIFASSAAIYGNTSILPKKVESIIDPESPYAIEKYAGEQYTKIYNSLYELPTTSIRFFNVYGPRQDPSSSYSGVLSIMNQKFIKGEHFTFYGDGNQTRDFVYIKDLVQAVNLVIKNENTNGKIYNLGTGSQTSLLKIFDEFKQAYSKTISFSFTDERNGDIKHSYADIDDLKSLGYKPEYSIKKGLIEYINSLN